MLFLLRQAMEGGDLAGKPGPAVSDHAKTMDFEQVLWHPKRKPGRDGPGKAFTAAQYSQESPENNVLFVNWLAD